VNAIETAYNYSEYYSNLWYNAGLVDGVMKSVVRNAMLHAISSAILSRFDSDVTLTLGIVVEKLEAMTGIGFCGDGSSDTTADYSNNAKGVEIARANPKLDDHALAALVVDSFPQLYRVKGRNGNTCNGDVVQIGHQF